MFEEHQRQPEPEKTQLPIELAALERRLAEIPAVKLRLDRDRLMFAAGRAAAEGPNHSSLAFAPASRGQIHGRHWFWPAATATMTAASLLLAVMLIRETQYRRELHSIASIAAPNNAQTAKAASPIVAVSAPYSLRRIDGWPYAAGPMTGYLADRRIVITGGLDALGRELLGANGNSNSVAKSSTLSPATTRQLLEELLPNAADTQGRS